MRVGIHHPDDLGFSSAPVLDDSGYFVTTPAHRARISAIFMNEGTTEAFRTATKCTGSACLLGSGSPTLLLRLFVKNATNCGSHIPRLVFIALHYHIKRRHLHHRAVGVIPN